MTTAPATQGGGGAGNPRLDDAFRRTYVAITLQLSRLQLLQLRDLNEQFGDDLEKGMIACALISGGLGATLNNPLEALHRLGVDGLPERTGQASIMRAQGIRELAELTGLPRETVRRKLHQLETNGQAERKGRSGWTYVIHGGPNERALQRDRMRQLLLGADQIRALLELAAERLS